MTIVVDASVVAAAITDTGRAGMWANERLTSDNLAAPHLMPVEVASVLRRAALAGKISADSASLAHRDLLDLSVGLFAYEDLAERVWELRGNFTSYDGWYVALAEQLDCPLVTLDNRLARAPGATCEFLTI